MPPVAARPAKEESGGAGGIRTLDTLLAYTHFPGERLRPLGHRSACPGRQAHLGAGRPQGKRAAKRSIALASSTSLPVTPPALWVLRATATLFQLFDQSG